MAIEIIVVDDNLQAAQDFARLITLKTKLEAVAFDDPNEVIEKIKSLPIKVVVLDQRMPQKTGTELFKEILKIDTNIKAINYK